MTESRKITVVPSAASIETILGEQDRTMPSHEIAELAGARHRDLVVVLDRLFDKGLLRATRESRTHQPPIGRPMQVYDLNARDTYLVIATYSDEVRAKIIDRWMELEATSKTLALNGMREQVLLELDEDSELRQKRVHAPEYDIGRALVRAAARNAAAVRWLLGNDKTGEGLKECLKRAMTRAVALKAQFAAPWVPATKDESTRALLEFQRAEEEKQRKRGMKGGLERLQEARQ